MSKTRQYECRCDGSWEGRTSEANGGLEEL